jgi:hypothetical protein
MYSCPASAAMFRHIVALLTASPRASDREYGVQDKLGVQDKQSQIGANLGLGYLTAQE